MQGNRAANRYAKALLDYAIEQNKLDEVYADVTLVHNTIKNNKELQRLLMSPIVKTLVKKNVLEKIFTNVTDEVKGLFRLLIENRRLPILYPITEKFVNQYNTFKNHQIAEVTTAVPMDDELKKQVLAKVETLTNNTNITLVNKVNPNIIGGFILRVGDVQYNASVAFKLNKLKQDFKETLFV
ncbi:MAG: ATP synthase F1 subunit delta [Capnocytophaga sp.]|nr:ATP synthase F1 subunit delta [Capnocytophaga sp.]